MYDMLSGVIRLKNNNIHDSDKTFYMEAFCHNHEDDIFLCLHPTESLGDLHKHDFFEINYVLSGCCTNFVEGRTMLMTAGNFLWMHPGTYHTAYSPNGGIVINILIRTEWFLSNFCKRSFPDSPMGLFLQHAASSRYYSYIFFPDTNPAFEHITAQLINEHKANSPHCSLRTNAKFIELLCAMIESDENAQLSSINIPSQAVLKMLSYIQENYTTVTLSKLAKYMNYSETHVGRLFKKYLNISFCDAVIDIRLNHAKSLLLATSKSSGEIAQQVGYDSVEYFHRLFKSHLGCTPREFRTNARNADIMVRQPILLSESGFQTYQGTEAPQMDAFLK